MTQGTETLCIMTHILMLSIMIFIKWHTLWCSFKHYDEHVDAHCECIIQNDTEHDKLDRETRYNNSQ